MSLQATVTIAWTLSGTDAGGGSEGSQASIVTTIPNSPALVTNWNLQNGTNSQAVPTPAPSFALLIPPSASSITKKWATNAGAGGDLHAALPTLIAIAAGATNVYIAANGSETVRVVWL
jgi:hypothetical protein